MQLDLLLPDLIWPDTTLPEIYRDLALPSLARLLGRARIERLPSGDTESYLLDTFGQPDDTAVAPMTGSADGLVTTEGHWLRADPVHLQLGRDALILADSGIFSMSQQEADDLVATLNRHFADDGLVFFAPHPVRWYVSMGSAPVMTTARVSTVIGKNIDTYLPSGRDGMRWHGILNEIQMLFFEHPVNTAREAAGDPVVNSIWVWGEGEPMKQVRHAYSRLFGDDPLLLALAKAGSSQVDGLPHHAQALLDASGEGSVMALCDSLRGAAQYDDARGWRERMLALEATWFTPLLAALDAGRIARLGLIVPGHFTATTTPADRWRFWRRPRSLSSLSQAAQ